MVTVFPTGYLDNLYTPHDVGLASMQLGEASEGGGGRGAVEGDWGNKLC